MRAMWAGPYAPTSRGVNSLPLRIARKRACLLPPIPQPAHPNPAEAPTKSPQCPDPLRKLRCFDMLNISTAPTTAHGTMK